MSYSNTGAWVDTNENGILEGTVIITNPRGKQAVIEYEDTNGDGWFSLGDEILSFTNPGGKEVPVAE